MPRHLVCIKCVKLSDEDSLVVDARSVAAVRPTISIMREWMETVCATI